MPLSSLIETVAAESGLYTVDASACYGLVTGYAVPGLMSGRDALEPLLDFYQLDAMERSGVLFVRPRTGDVSTLIETANLAVSQEVAGGAPYEVLRAQAEDLPTRLTLTYTESLGSYQTQTATAEDPSAVGEQQMVLNVPLVIEESEARGRTQLVLAEARAMREQIKFALPPGDAHIEPGDVVALTLNADEQARVRVTEILDGNLRHVRGVATLTGLYQPQIADGSIADGPAPNSPVVASPVAFALMDLPLLPDDQDGAYLHTAAYADPWPGVVSVRWGEGAAAPVLSTITAPSIMGRLDAALAPGPLSQWDEANTATLTLNAGGLSSTTALGALNGERRAAVETSAGWEIFGYRDAVLGEDGKWRLSGLLRALRGTDQAMAAGAPVGARIVFLSSSVVAAPLTLDRIGEEQTLQIGPSSAAPGAFPYQQVALTPAAASLRPFSPVHLAATRVGDTITLSWIRRTRQGGDNWAMADVPLGEQSEAYQVTTFNAAEEVIATYEVTSPSATFPEGDVAAATVAQISNATGPGTPARWDRGAL